MDFSGLNAGVLMTLFEAVKTDANAVKVALRNELVKRLDAPAVATASNRGRKKDDTPKDGTAVVPVDGTKRTSLKSIVRDILSRHPDGVDLGGIVIEVEKLIEKKEYTTTAKNVSSVVSQALHKLREEKTILHDKEKKKYFPQITAA